ncbi:hypothetical protein FRC12_018117, partial [Ceratobasidium sp. 428]
MCTPLCVPIPPISIKGCTLLGEPITRSFSTHVKPALLNLVVLTSTKRQNHGYSSCLFVATSFYASSNQPHTDSIDYNFQMNLYLKWVNSPSSRSDETRPNQAGASASITSTRPATRSYRFAGSWCFRMQLPKVGARRAPSRAVQS